MLSLSKTNYQRKGVEGMSDTTDDLDVGYDGEEDSFESEELEQIFLLKKEICALKKCFMD